MLHSPIFQKNSLIKSLGIPINGLIIQFNATDLSSLNNRGSDDRVSLWYDTSYHAHHAVQEQNLLQPKFNQDLNGIPWIVTNNGQHFITPYYPIGTESICLTILIKESANPNKSIYGAHDGRNHRQYLRYEQHSQTLLFGIGNSFINTNKTLIPDTIYNIVITCDGNLANLWIDNEIEIANLPYQSGVSIDPLIIFARTFNGNIVDFWNGQLSFFALYNRPLKLFEVESFFN